MLVIRATCFCLYKQRTKEFAREDFISRTYNKKSIEKRYLSEWFGGTYTIGFSSDLQDTFKVNGNVKANPASLGAGWVYGAVKYNGNWLGARILKEK